MDFMNKLVFALTVMVISMLIVFFGLTILIICIKALSALLDTKKKELKTDSSAAPVVIPEPVAQSAVAENGADANELIAVITAALTAFIRSEKSGKTLIVRNIRAAKPNVWAHAGRTDQLNSRF